jgi:hypothetical protein
MFDPNTLSEDQKKAFKLNKEKMVAIQVMREEQAKNVNYSTMDKKDRDQVLKTIEPDIQTAAKEIRSAELSKKLGNARDAYHMATQLQDMSITVGKGTEVFSDKIMAVIAWLQAGAYDKIKAAIATPADMMAMTADELADAFAETATKISGESKPPLYWRDKTADFISNVKSSYDSTKFKADMKGIKDLPVKEAKIKLTIRIREDYKAKHADKPDVDEESFVELVDEEFTQEVQKGLSEGRLSKATMGKMVKRSATRHGLFA